MRQVNATPAVTLLADGWYVHTSDPEAIAAFGSAWLPLPFTQNAPLELVVGHFRALGAVCVVISLTPPSSSM